MYVSSNQKELNKPYQDDKPTKGNIHRAHTSIVHYIKCLSQQQWQLKNKVKIDYRKHNNANKKTLTINQLEKAISHWQNDAATLDAQYIKLPTIHLSITNR